MRASPRMDLDRRGRVKPRKRRRNHERRLPKRMSVRNPGDLVALDTVEIHRSTAVSFTADHHTVPEPAVVNSRLILALPPFFPTRWRSTQPALAAWLIWYNAQKPHRALAGNTPTSCIPTPKTDNYYGPLHPLDFSCAGRRYNNLLNRAKFSIKPEQTSIKRGNIPVEQITSIFVNGYWNPPWWAAPTRWR